MTDRSHHRGMAPDAPDNQPEPPPGAKHGKMAAAVRASEAAMGDLLDLPGDGLTLGFQRFDVGRQHRNRYFRCGGAGYGDGLGCQGLENGVDQGLGVLLGAFTRPRQHPGLAGSLELRRSGVVDQQLQHESALQGFTCKDAFQ